MAKKSVSKISGKHLLIDKANQFALVSLSVAVVIFIFGLFAALALFKQNTYNQRVIKEKKKALKQIKTNHENVKELTDAYRSFATETTNVLGGNPAGEGPKDGDNPRIILDSLPSKYDFPGFASSMEKLIQSQGNLTIESLGGTDTGSGATASTSKASTSKTSNSKASSSTSSSPVVPIPLVMPITVRSDYAKIQQYIKSLENSIRPIYIDTFRLNGSDNNLQLELRIQTFYLPEKIIEVKSKVVE